jgi:hypothetical protein
MRFRRGVFALVATACWAPVVAVDAQTVQAPIFLTVETPTTGSAVGGEHAVALVTGRAVSQTANGLDLVLVIDKSGGAAEPSGLDVDGDGTVGVRPTRRLLGQTLSGSVTDEDDSILSAEIAVSRALIEGLDSRTARVGLVAFAGDDDPETPDALTEVPLTSDFAELARGLDEIRRGGPHGKRNMVSGVNLAAIELLGTASAKSQRRDDQPRRVIAFFAGGQPTLPLEASLLQNATMTIQQAVRAAKFEIRVDTFAIGRDTLTEPVVPSEMARVARGVFTPIRQRADYPASRGAAYFSGVEGVVIRNTSTGQEAPQILRRLDGTFAALVPLREGDNQIEVRTLLRPGWPEAAQTLDVRFDPKARDSLSPDLSTLRDSLLEKR